jgi:hypothetical protein
LFKSLLSIFKDIFSGGKTSINAERNGARSVRRQGEHSVVRQLFLCAVPKVTEWKKCSERVRRNAWNKVTEGTGTIFENFKLVGKGKCNEGMSDSTLAQGDLRNVGVALACGTGSS